MGAKGKYLEKIYEGRWKVIERKYGGCGNITGYFIENIYNKERMYINHNVMPLVDRGKTSISKIRKKRAIKNKKRTLIKYYYG